MAGILDKLKDAAIKAGEAGARDPRLRKAAENIITTVDSFKKGYRESREPERYKLVCPHCSHDLPPTANYCPHCGARVD